jgi:hypothetical protein
MPPIAYERTVLADSLWADTAIRHWFGDARARPDLALLAQIAVSRHSGHLPLNRQAVVMARHRVAIGRSTLADRMGRTGCGDRAR